ncbi:MAG: hypothetical protein AB1546_15060 [bacterium]
MSNFKILAFLTSQIILALIIFPLVINLARRGGHLRVNFRGEMIPSSAGIGFVLLFLIEKLITTTILPSGEQNIFAYIILILVIGFGFLGLMDDFFAKREKGGITGHLRELTRQGTVSTALFKAFFALVLCTIVFKSIMKNEGLLPVLVVSMSANSMNLLDVKPGRALKGFWLVFIFLAVFWQSSWNLPPMFLFTTFASFFVWTIVYALWDFRCRAMMGDVGSNVLGMILGLMVIWGFPSYMHVAALIFLIILHLIGEFYSISKIIEKFSFLRWLDNLGIKIEHKS